MRMALIWIACLVGVVASGCMTRHEVVIEPKETACIMYGVTMEDINRAVASGPRDVKRLGRVTVKVLPDGTPVPLKRVARIRYREVKPGRRR